jgi:hypothetical protein
MPTCRVCGNPLAFANGLYCSPSCYRIYLERAQSALEPVAAPSPTTQPATTNEPVTHEHVFVPDFVSLPSDVPDDSPSMINLVPVVIPGGASKQCRATSLRIQGILADVQLGLNEKEACAIAGVNYRTWQRWKKMSKAFPILAAHASGIRKKVLLKRVWEMSINKRESDWKAPAWELERRWPEQFGDPVKAAINLTQNNNVLNLMDGQTLDQARAALEEVKRIKAARRVNIAIEAAREANAAEPDSNGHQH